MPRPDERYGYEGFSQLAHAVRRVGALDAALRFCPPDATEEDVFAMADRAAAWIGGHALEAEAAQQPAAPLGVPWGQRDQPGG